jgi:hypothetical protein
MKRLVLGRETLRRLNRPDMLAVDGGRFVPTRFPCPISPITEGCQLSDYICELTGDCETYHCIQGTTDCVIVSLGCPGVY